MDETAETVTAFWLTVGPEGWYRTDPALDRAIEARFRALSDDAAAGRLASWERSARGALALLILLDQFPRNMFRGSAAAFSRDDAARGVAMRAFAAGHDLATPEPERQFFYLPLMHSETLADQDRCCALIAERMPETGMENHSHAERHRAVIARFGRFPSRNAALGRADTEAERTYRAEGGYMG